MNESLQARIEHLETLYSEQEYTLQALNDMVAHQERKISSLILSIETLKHQFKALKAEPVGNLGSEDEKPPHY